MGRPSYCWATENVELSMEQHPKPGYLSRTESPVIPTVRAFISTSLSTPRLIQCHAGQSFEKLNLSLTNRHSQFHKGDHHHWLCAIRMICEARAAPQFSRQR